MFNTDLNVDAEDIDIWNYARDHGLTLLHT